MEYIDIYDVNRMRTGEKFIRGAALEKGQYHLVVHTCIINSRDEMLIQHRVKEKAMWPDKWDLSSGGAVSSGDTSQQSAQRELREELGLQWDYSGIRPKFSINFERGFDDIYVIRKDLDIEKLKLQKEEVDMVKWATREEIISMIEEGVFLPYYKNLINLIFDAADSYGCIDE